MKLPSPNWLIRWFSLAMGLTPCLTQGNQYTVNVRSGITFYANHLAPNVVSLDEMWSVPPNDGMLFTKYNSPNPAQGYSTFSYFGGWESFPAPQLDRGEGAIVDNTSLPAFTVTVSDSLPTSTILVPPQSLIPSTLPDSHRYIRGRQDISGSKALGTFENVIGRSPKDFTFVEVLRFNPFASHPLFAHTPGGLEVYSFFQNSGHWSPRAPILEPGEAAFFNIGQLNGVNVPIATTFAINGITPNHGSDLQGNLTLYFTGTGLSLSDTVELQQSGIHIPGTVDIALSDIPYVLAATFNLNTHHASGPYNANVTRAGGNPTRTLYSPFLLKKSGPDLGIEILGRDTTRPGRTDTYYLRVRNNGSLPLTTTLDLDALIPAGMTLTLLGSGTGVVTGGPTGPFHVVDTVTLDASGSVNGTDSVSYPFQLTAGASLIAGTILDLTGQIVAPIVDDDEVHFPIRVIASFDPNDKTGPSGVGDGHFITGRESFDYRISFENKPTASAAAQVVEIVDQLDPTKLDIATVELGAVQFGSQVVFPPSGSQALSTDVPYDVDGNPATPEDNVVVRIQAALDTVDGSPTFGLLRWTFRTLDASTLAPIPLPEIGFLPANVTAPEGQGSVMFRIKPHSNLATGDSIQNGARITFDANAPILTPVWVNTVDQTPPESNVLPLPATQNSPTFIVSWSGTDAGAGIATYDIFVSTDGGAYAPLLAGTTATSTPFIGQTGHEYSFYSVATDLLGQSEEPPATADATTRIQIQPSETPASRLGELMALVRSFHLARGIEQGLLAKLQAALKSVNSGRKESACEQLGAFREDLHELAPKKLTRAQVAQLAAAATEIQALLGCLPGHGSHDDDDRGHEDDRGQDRADAKDRS